MYDLYLIYEEMDAYQDQVTHHLKMVSVSLNREWRGKRQILYT